MSDHPIQGLMKTAMESIKEMVDVNTVIGDAIETPDGNVIIPISKVGFGFAAGGTEFENDEKDAEAFPFGGGSGGGVSVQPVGFLVVGNEQVRLLPVNNNAIFDRLIDLAPQILDKFQTLFDENGQEVDKNKLQKLEAELAQLKAEVEN
ncbi:GerW family sporulation protein [Proteinivorax hydrogeniformans]|uniref:GerW family sporulation protein n=1 Tax=Proteinivorax hydrogeniformans TaxID=1826727 RepID=A0AAU8HRJ2_9FIRM